MNGGERLACLKQRFEFSLDILKRALIDVKTDVLADGLLRRKTENRARFFVPFPDAHVGRPHDDAQGRGRMQRLEPFAVFLARIERRLELTEARLPET